MPGEVLLNIIRHLADDKPTLVNCMGVSMALNAMTAPLLYRSVILKGSTGMFDHTLPESGNDLKSRMSQNKDHNLDYIDDVTFAAHRHIGRCCDAQSVKRTINVSLLRISVDSGDIGGSWQCCSCLKGIIPRKLVLYDQVTLLNPTNVNIAMDKTVMVSHDMFHSQGYCLWRLLRYAPNSGPMVFIFWSSPSTPNEDIGSPRREWNEFQGNVFERAQWDRYPKEMAFVNIERIAAPSLHDLDGSRTLCDYAAEAHRRLYINELDNHIARQSGHGGGCCRYTEMARNTKFTFVTMRDYLKNWDWKGELTDEEVRPWLESRKLVDEALESELEVEVGGK